MKAHGIAPIDLLVVNLYPFEATVAKGAGFEDCIENIDIGGPAMIRAAAKNHDDVAVVVDPQDYQRRARRTRRQQGRDHAGAAPPLAAKAYARTAAYDAAISNWFAAQLGDRRAGVPRLRRPADPGAALRREPAPDAAFYRTPDKRPASPPRGRCRARSSPTTTSTTPTRPMNASPSSIRSAHRRLRHRQARQPLRRRRRRDLVERLSQGAGLRFDVSAFGGIVALNRTLDAEAARAITEIFTEVIIAPDATEEAIAIVAREEEPAAAAGRRPARSARAGLTVKPSPAACWCRAATTPWSTTWTLKVVTKRAPTDAELRDLKFAFRVAKHVKSNTIVYAKDLATVGIGAGQMSRVDSARIAARKAQDAAKELKLAEPLTKGSVVASDAFFPFADGCWSRSRPAPPR
jgi:phosphoribosylaminoimidazolecarboxamide formyltransferase/IMP cyclohydrolase